ncbi:hypothetical protein J4231_03750 [Candidatus Woesearchaeota archaeon]|nr:hypothetical protein [Candidatus Woesearchaeota archaeon]
MKGKYIDELMDVHVSTGMDLRFHLYKFSGKYAELLNFDSQKHIDNLSKRAKRLCRRLHWLENNGVTGTVYKALSSFYNGLVGRKEIPLVDEFNILVDEAMTISSFLGDSLSMYKSHFKGVEKLIAKKTGAIQRYKELRDGLTEKNNENNGLLDEIVLRLDEVKTNNGLGMEEIKYGDAKADLSFRIAATESRINALSKRIQFNTGLLGELESEKKRHREFTDVVRLLYSGYHAITKSFLKSSAIAHRLYSLDKGTPA